VRGEEGNNMETVDTEVCYVSDQSDYHFDNSQTTKYTDLRTTPSPAKSPKTKHHLAW
jgi:hypothetical protein